DRHVFLQVRRATADDVLGDLDLVIGLGVHEVKAVAILIEVVEIAVLDGGLLDLIGGLVALGHLHAVADAAHLDLADRGSLAGMDVFGAEDDVELAILLNDVALADRTGDDSQGFFPELLASGRSGQVCPWPTEAVSGGNILICPPDATLFPALFDGMSSPPWTVALLEWKRCQPR